MKVLAYTNAARGHLFPTVPVLLELQRRGHEVMVVTLAAEVRTLRDLGFKAEPLAPAIEAMTLEDYQEKNPLASLKAGVRNFIDRGELEVPELARLLAEESPDVLLVDFLCWGAVAAAEASGLPWAVIQHSPTPLPDPEIPPFGPGLPLRRGPLGRLRNRLMTPLTFGMLERVALPGANALRAAAGAPPLRDGTDMFSRAPLTIYVTSTALEYPRASWPDSFCFTGPLNWDPPAEEPAWLRAIQRPAALVTTSSEFQDDGELVRAALAGLADSDLAVVATMPAGVGAYDVPANARLEQWVPHSQVLPACAVAITHGGFGATQKALAHGVPVVVVPFGRDQLEVGRRVEASGAGVLLGRKRLTPSSLRAAVAQARSLGPAAASLAAAMAAEGGAALAADRLEALSRSAAR